MGGKGVDRGVTPCLIVVFYCFFSNDHNEASDRSENLKRLSLATYGKILATAMIILYV